MEPKVKLVVEGLELLAQCLREDARALTQVEFETLYQVVSGSCHAILARLK